ncbi:AMP-binding protein [Xylophilus sp. GW821-FHT01B05]
MPIDFPTVHAPLAWWAARTPHALALDDGTLRLDFAGLAAQVATGAQALHDAPAIAWVDGSASPGAQIVRFLAILASGRTAAVSDPDWPPAVRTQVLARMQGVASPTAPGQAGVPQGPFYIGFTSGSTGVPKGFRRSHRSWTSSFAVCVDTFGAGASAPVLAPGRMSHSLFLFGALMGLWSGAGMHLQPRFSATAALQTLRRGDALCLVAVPSQLLLMLELARRQRLAPVPATQLILISGAPWPRARTADLQALFPQARIVEFYGASETSFIAWADSDAALPHSAVGRPFANVQLRIDASGDDANAGLIYVRSPMVFDDYVTLAPGQDGSAVLRDGDWLSVRDMGHVDEQGFLHLRGRQQRMFTVQGKNLFPEEVEHALAAHPAVAAVSVQPMPDALRGQQPVAVLQLRELDAVTATALATWCRTRLEPYKTPRHFYLCPDWPRTPSGKTDHPQLARWLADAGTAQLQPL